MNYQTILVPVDGSACSESILPQVAIMAKAHNATVVLLKVIEPPLLLGYDETVDYQSYRRKRRKMELESEAYLSDLEDRLGAEGIHTKTLVESGIVVETILEVAYRENTDLVAISSHGWSRLRKSYYTSTAAGLLKDTGLPLLIARVQTEAP